MITIANREVKIGDQLYHVGKRRWGTVVRYDVNTAILRISSPDDATNYVDRYITAGGLDKGERQVYWHEPLDLDLPYRDTSKVRRLLAFLLSEL